MNWLARQQLRLRFQHWAPRRADRHPSFYLSHSQFGEDMAARAILGDRRDGVYVDIGAHHPVYFSNTYHFYRRGWRGLNVDAMPGSMEAFRVLRPRDTNVEACIAPARGQTLTYYMFEQSALNTFDSAAALAAQARGSRLRDTRQLPCMTLVECLETHLPSPSIDLFNIDVEGLDEAILRSNNWERYRPRILIFERHGLDVESIRDNSLITYLRDLGYAVEAKCGPSIIMQHAEARDRGGNGRR